MDKKKPIGYSKKDTSEMKALIERTEPKSGDYVGSGTVTTVPKKKKKMKRMMDGGMAHTMSGNPGKGSEGPGMPKTGGMARDARMIKRIQEKFGKMSSRFPGYKPELASPVDTRDELKSYRMGLGDYRRANPGIKPVRGPLPAPPAIPPNQPTMKGGGLARKGVGQALAKGGLVKANGCAARGKTKGKMV